MRGMRLGLARGAVLIAALLGTSGAAMAAAGITQTTIRSLSGDEVTRVTYSRTGAKPLNSYLAYEITVQNVSGNTINNIVAQGTATARNVGEFITFSSSDGQVSCTGGVTPLFADFVAANALSFNCSIGQLKAGVPATFIVFLNSPQGSGDPAGDYAGLRGVTITAEGANKGNSRNDSVDFWPQGRGALAQTPPPGVCDGAAFDPSVAPIDLTTSLPSTITHYCSKVALGTADGKRLKSAVPKQGGTFFTGIDGVPGYGIPDPDNGNAIVTDLFTTTVTVPQSTIIADAAVIEDPVAVGCINFSTCYSSTLAIIDVATTTTADFTGQTTPYMTFILRMDSSNILPGVNINKVVVYYEGQPVGDCPNATTPLGGGVPCIAKRTAYKKNPGRNVDPALSLDFEWTILNNKNGRLLLL